MQSATILGLNNGSPRVWNKLVKAYSLALEEAYRSPCVRRKYGSILYTDNVYVAAHNNRVSRCCDDMCIRDVMNVSHGHNTDIGAEIHSEQSLLIDFKYEKGFLFLIAGIGRDGSPLYGLDCWPCYSCARIIKHSGITHVWVPEADQTFTNYSIDGILEDYEHQILGSLGDF